ncbi:MAG: cytochrome c oxidase subunit 3 [Bacteroidia bacterium]|nr:cytochrome c oxidase subunit 3 [Bacteroidia bacterium]
MANTATVSTGASNAWAGGKKPFKASYGKLMMWFFLMSDAFTFSSLLVVYGLIRFSSSVPWADPEKVFTHFPIITETFHLHPPLAFVGLMTFILIASSVTMVLAVEAGHRMDRKAVEKYMLWTILGGLAFVSCQAYEWYNFIVGGHPSMREFWDGGLEQWVTGMYQGASLTVNEYCENPDFANLFFFITGFHGSHVFSGVVINFIIYLNVRKGTYDKRGHYEMVEKVGLYWHFVDLVWVFVFTFFYLV